jgi:hypothetical protein
MHSCYSFKLPELDFALEEKGSLFAMSRKKRAALQWILDNERETALG